MTTTENSGLAYLGLITDLESVPNSDNLMLATAVCGKGGKWRGIVRKEDFKIGDRANVYLPDSVLPDEPSFEFMRKYKFRVRQMRFRGCPSECLIMPYQYGCEVGDDVSDDARIERYVKQLPVTMDGESLGLFPVFIPKTDEPNFQSVPHLVETLVGMRYYATEKADGTSCTVYYKNGHFGVCSRNLEKKDGQNVYWESARSYGLQEKLPRLGEYALQYEIVGPGIQGNPMGLRQREIRLFDVIDLNDRRYLGWLDVEKFAKDLDIPTVLCYIYGHPFMMNHEQLLKFAEKYYSNGNPAEGVVFRPTEPLSVLNQRVSFKVINLLYKEYDNDMKKPGEQN